MKLDMKILKWVFLTLYIAIIVGLFGMAYMGTLPEWFFFLEGLHKELFWTVLLLVLTIGSQALFIFGSGTINLCQPIRRRRLVIPVIIATFMMAVLVAGLFLSLMELFEMEGNDWSQYVFWIILGLAWAGWSIAFFLECVDTDRYTTVRNLISVILAGSLIELLVAVPSHLIVSRRPGCFVGIMTAMGISGGIAVMLWSFGPGVILLFLREKRDTERAREKKNHEGRGDQQQPEYGQG